MAEVSVKTAEIKQRPALRSVLPTEVPTPDLSILIVTWNSERWIDRCLRSLPAACEGLSYEIVVYDNASSDETLRHVPEKGTQILRAKANDGFAAGTNRAFARSRGRYVFLLNPDCELEPGSVTRLCEFLDQNAIAAAAAPLLVDEHGGLQREFQLRRLPGLRTLASEALLLDKIFPKNRVTAHYRYRELDLSHPQRVEQPAAAALLIRREVFDEVGPFDEQFTPAWFEDVDYCRRLAAAKKEIFTVPTAVARHYGGASLDAMAYSEFIDLWYRNMWRYARKWFSRGEAETLRWTIVVGMLARWMAALTGVRNGTSSRREALRAYKTVLKKALNRWDGSSPSSS